MKIWFFWVDTRVGWDVDEVRAKNAFEAEKKTSSQVYKMWLSGG